MPVVVQPLLIAACAGAGTANTPDTAPVKTKPVTAAATATASTSFHSAPAATAATPITTAVPEHVKDAPAGVVPAVMPDVDYWATPQPVVEKMLDLAKVKATDVVYDLGCGDARSLVTAAERYGAKGVGFDIDPQLVAEARANVRRHGVEHLVRIEQANIFGLDLSGADVVFLYITPRFNLRLVPQFEKMHRGSRIVSHEFEIPGAKPTRVVRVSGPPDGPPDADQPAKDVQHTIFLWRMPWTRVRTDWKSD